MKEKRFLFRRGRFTAVLLGMLLVGSTQAFEIRWFELVTDDAAAANAFYSALFGWQIEKTPTGAYSARLSGQEIAGISEIESSGEGSYESQWFPVFIIDDLHVTLNNASDAGAEVLVEITHVKGYGEYAVIRDTQGGILMLSDTAAVDRASETAGNWVWGELWTSDPKSSATFYKRMAGLEVLKEQGNSELAGNVFAHKGEFIAGFMPVGDAKFDTRWAGYIAVEDIDETLEMAKKLGGEVFDKNADHHGEGKAAVLADPTGAVFFIYELDSSHTGGES